MSSDPTSSPHDEQVRELKRDLQRRIDRVRPIIQQMERGDLKILTDVQQKQVDLYPSWLKDMECLRNGVLPIKKVEPAKSPQKAAASNSQAGSPDVAGISPDSKKTGKQLKREKSQQNRERRLVALASLEHDAERLLLLQQLRDASKTARSALLDSHLRTIIDMKPLAQITREYESICTLRRDVHTGRIAQVTNAQLAKLQMLDSVKREMALEEEKLAAQRERIKATLLAEMEDLIAAEQQLLKQEEQEEEQDEDQQQEDRCEDFAEGQQGGADEQEEVTIRNGSDSHNERSEAQTDEVEEEKGGLADAAIEVEMTSVVEDKKDEKDSVTENLCEAHAVAEAEPVTNGTAHRAVEPDKDEQANAGKDENEEEENMLAEVAKQQKKGKKQQQKQKAAAAAAAAPEPEPETPEVTYEAGEVVVEPAVEVKKEIDWSELSYKKNRPKLVFQAVQVLAQQQQLSEAEKKVVSSPTSRQTPFHQFNELTIGRAAPSAAAVPPQKPSAAAAAQKSSQPKASSGKQPTAGIQARAASTSAPAAGVQAGPFQTAVQRVARDVVYCQRNPLPNVRFAVHDSSILEWHVNVSPTDGPLCGAVVHLIVKFDHTYPMQPPLVIATTEIPHPSFITSGGVRNALCLTHTMTEEWEPQYGAFSILSQLQSVFSDESFSKAKMALGGDFKNRAATCRAELSRYRCTAGGCRHCPEAPHPSIPVFNGPFAGADFNRLRAGAVHGPGKFSWAHRYVLEGSHEFSLLVERGHALVTLLNGSSTSDDEPASNSTWSLDTQSGILTTPTQTTLKPTEGGVTARNGSIVTFSLRDALLTVRVDGKEIHSNVSLAPWSTIRPMISVSRNKDIVTCAFALDDATTDSSFFPSAQQQQLATADETTKQLRCFVSLATIEDDILGYVIEIARGKDGALPTEATISQPSSADLISLGAFDTLRGKRLWGRRFDGFLPLLLDAKNAQKALPELKRQVTLMCRNPSASSSYTPPYKPSNALLVFPSLLTNIVKTCTRNPTIQAEEAFLLTTRVFQGFAALAADSAAIVSEAAAIVDRGECSSGVVFALSPIVDHPWPTIVQVALRAELRKSDEIKSGSSDADLYGSIPRARRRQFCTAATFARALRRTSVLKLLQELSELGGVAAPEALAEVVAATEVQIPAITSWDGLCSLLGVNLTAKDLLA